MPAAAAIPLAFAISAGTTGFQIAESVKARKQQKRALRAQETANRQAVSRAAAEQRRSAIEERRLNRRQPDIESLLRDSQRPSGAGATLLTGTGGRRPNTLQSSSLLGGS